MNRLQRAQRAAMDLLREHYESNDPFMDDNPTGRHMAAEHRKTCKRCKVYAAYLRSLWKEPKR